MVRLLMSKTAVIESFGKAFLLPLDVILGWIFTNNKRQRIFNRASNTIVIKIKEEIKQYIEECNVSEGLVLLVILSHV